MHSTTVLLSSELLCSCTLMHVCATAFVRIAWSHRTPVMRRIKADFEALLAENAALPEAERLPRSHFDIDPELRGRLQAEAAAAEAAAEAEVAFERERQRLTLAKLKGTIRSAALEHCYTGPALAAKYYQATQQLDTVACCGQQALR
jgi:hypothetical protein